MSCRLPGADNTKNFWDLLHEGRDVHSVVPPLRWDAETHVDISNRPRKNTSATPYGCWLDEPGAFDAKFFGMSPREAEQTDPAQRLALMTAYEALEDAGIVPGVGSSRRERIGVCYGVTSNDWMETNSAQNIDTFMIPGGNRAFIPGRISYFFKFTGPSLAIDTACSSSLMAIHIAYNMLCTGEADIMRTFPIKNWKLQNFDEEADGYCRGEGVGTVILKRLDDASRDQDPIKAVILNACTNHNAEAASITRPCVEAQRHVFTKVLNGLEPAHVTYIEMHGTGTQVGDATEMASVLEALAPDSGPRCRSETPVYVGSVKANLGHGEAAAGITSLIKLVLMMQHNTIPPHIGIKNRINSKFPKDLGSRGVLIAKETVSWPRTQTPRMALLNNFSAAGGNSVLLLQDAPLEEDLSVSDSRSAHPVVLSAKTYSALLAGQQALLSYIQQNPNVHLPSLSYTTTSRRLHHSHRMAVSGGSIQAIAAGLSQAIEKETGKAKSLKGTLVMAFAGQGSHYIGMGRDLYQNLTSFRDDINHFSRIAAHEGLSAFLPLIRDSDGDPNKFSSEAVQLAIVSLQMALTRLWASWGVKPDAVIGHSLGHYAALNAAGVISAADTIFLVGTRARQLQGKCQPGTHGMLLVRTSVSVIEKHLGETSVEVACINSPFEVVLSGTKADIELVRSRLALKGIFSQMLDVPYAFHSSQVDSFLADFSSSISQIRFAPSSIPILCPLSAKVAEVETEFGPAHLVEHCRGRVNFHGAIKAGETSKIVTEKTIFVEIGHRRLLHSTVQALSSLTKKGDSWNTLTQTLAKIYMTGYDVKWEEYHKDFSTNLRVISLPHYKWDLKHFWIRYVHDWSLCKGDPQRTADSRPGLISNLIHSVLIEDIDASIRSGSIVVRTDLGSEKLLAIIQGHKVDGFPLSTPSIYADIALTVARYLQNRQGSLTMRKQISIDSLNIEKALVADSTTPRWLQTEIKVLAGTDSMGLECQFSSVQVNGACIANHARCTISFTEPPSPKWLEEKYTQTRQQIDALYQKSILEQCFRFSTNMIYRMVATLAEFGPNYRGLQEVVLDSLVMAAASRINFDLISVRDIEAYAAHPACVDALSQSAGFIMNANEASNPDIECFVNHGWESLQLYEDLTREKLYESYIQMKKSESNTWKGDLYVIRGDRLAVFIEGIKLQGVPRKLLRQVLSASHRAQSTQDTHTLDKRPPKPPILRQQREERSTSKEQQQVPLAIEKINDIIAEESGISRADILDDTDFTALGVDSLLALLITARLKEELGYDIGPTISIFDRFRTIGQLKKSYIETRNDLRHQDNPASDSRGWGLKTDTSAQILSDRSPNSRSLENSPEADSLLSQSINGCEPVRAVTSVILHHAAVAPGDTQLMLFLFPDGSGSASSYTQIPPISAHVALVGLICPYRRDPQAMTLSLEALVASYVREIRRVQPYGAYSLGGWSTGGVLAYRAAQKLLDDGFSVRDLVLIDSPAANGGVEPLPTRFYDHCSETGIFGQIGDHGVSTADTTDPPEWLIPHFKATIDLLSGYHATPLQIPSDVAWPRGALCWAGRTALDGRLHERFEWREGDGEGVRFLAEARTDFGAGAWAQLVLPTGSGEGIYIDVLPDWDHFSMMHGQGAHALAAFLARALLPVKREENQSYPE
ncbi:hypothetical protein EKO27_g4373 [Xylaria grammica]|uniref:Uncharacterized protein n=1 Tax=Xylaria grammica TaxID=363999 RepID=A0A439D8M6_9PEZI|nr:hypothetical protein EKO27_g4373 [Xylaria grammica]